MKKVAVRAFFLTGNQIRRIFPFLRYLGYLRVRYLSFKQIGSFALSCPYRQNNGGKMIITNIETVPGKNIIEHFGLVAGSTIRAKHVGRDIMASLKNMVGGELKGYTQLLQESRQQALDRMVDQARQLGANAIINVRFSTSSVAQGAAELYAYGTAVLVE